MKLIRIPVIVRLPMALRLIIGLRLIENARLIFLTEGGFKPVRMVAL